MMTNTQVLRTDDIAGVEGKRESALALRIRSVAQNAWKVRLKANAATKAREEANPTPSAPKVVLVPLEGGGRTLVRESDRATADVRCGYTRALTRCRPISGEEELELARAVRDNGDEAASARLVSAHLRLVMKIADEYGRPGDNFMDLVQEGNLGLLRAVQKFDPERGVKLASYATWWIRAYMLKYVMANYRLVRMGTTLEERRLFFRLRKERDRLERAGEPSDADALAKTLNVRPRKVLEMQTRIDGADTSLDAPVRDNSGVTALTGLPSSPDSRPDVRLEDMEYRVRVRGIIDEFAAGLDGRDREVMEARLMSEKPLTFRELGARYGVSRERARQIEVALKDRLRQFMLDRLGSGSEDLIIPLGGRRRR